MAIIYVNSGAGGTNTGASWTNAYTSLASTTGAAAGDEIYVHKTHSQDPGATVTYNWSNGTEANPVRIICVDKDASDALSTGAAIAQTVSGRDITLSGSIYVDGVTFTSTNNLLIGSGSKTQVYRNVTMNITVSASSRSIQVQGTAAKCQFFNCTINPSNASGSNFANAAAGVVELIACTFTFHASATEGITCSSSGLISLRACNVGSCTTAFGISTAATQIRASRCKLGTHTNIFSATPGLSSIGICDESGSSTVTGPTIGLIEYADDRGKVKGDSGRYRTGGATRDSVGFSWEMTPNSSAEERINILRTPEFSRKVTSGSKTITVYIAGGAEMYDDEVWLELEGPATTNTVQGYVYTSRAAYRTTRAVLTSDGTSTWNGSGVGTVRKISHTYTPDHDGLLVARVCYAKTSGAAIYVDPQMDVA